ncbi:DNA double-strand break repair nuclease NurA [Deinococcus sp. MIMF12]|uniref:DNA double-strand break repair nuclease NurA n=1 Tax=Deinococcus rhizophilus TaxID=3049544 RepID=A0ABT7JHI7_9DEIO|nr:DNA double-strand break repair nuclease NurA [Deinococcus rhizophilus]MDL2344521.1 DNA double-strand break repair nuclease NurA [Deinococcus rhizophilus]
MRIRLDPWPVDTQDGQLTLKPFAGLVFNAETDHWAAIPTRGIPHRMRRLLVVDGKPRMEARLLLDDEAGGMSVAGFGAFVVGAVDLCPHGSRQAQLQGVSASRVLAYSGDTPLEVTRLSPRNPHSGLLEYQPHAFAGAQVEGARAAVQTLMLRREQAMSAELASPLPLDETDVDALPDTLVLQDGPVRPGEAGRAVVGYVKTLHTDYLGADRIGLLTALRPGERTPVLRFKLGDRGEGTGEGREQRFTWYVRLCDAPFYQHPLAGVMRLEMHAPEDTDFVPRGVQDIADLSGALLCRLASQPHKDPRAPQNLIPTAALEQAMGRAMGSPEMVTRRIRAHLAGQYGPRVVA